MGGDRMIFSPFYIILLCSVGFLTISALLYIIFVFLNVGEKYPRLEKIGAVLVAIGMVTSGAMMGFLNLALSYGDKDVVIESEVIDIIDLPNASVEIIFTNDEITGVKVLESMNHLVGIKTYTNVLCENPSEATLLQIAKQKCALVFMNKTIIYYDKETAILI